MEIFDECALIGAAILSAQRFEFALYGIVSHVSHLPEAQKDKRFRDLTPERFLRGNIEEFKATLGQLEKQFGQKLMISSIELTEFINDRNVIAHNYWRLTKANINGAGKLSDPEAFLRAFLERCDRWTSIVRGLLHIIRRVIAEKEGKLSDIIFDPQQLIEIAAFHSHAQSARSSQVAPTA